MSDASPEPEVIPVPPAERTLASLPPEIIRMIAARLPTWSRACCVAVSKVVREKFLPWLFESVVLGSTNSPYFVSEPTQKLFRLNASGVRLFASSTGLKHAQLLYRQQVCGLHDLKLGFSPTMSIDADQAGRVVGDLVRTNPNLVRMNVRGSLDWVRGLSNMTSCQHSHLVSLTINWLDKDLVPMVGEGEELDVSSPAEVGMLANLETLSLYRFVGSLHQIAELISRCGKLKVVEFHEMRWTLSGEGFDLLVGPLRRVGHISWAVREIGEGDLAQYLALGPQLSRSFTVGPSRARDLNSLVLHAKRIRSLTLSVKTKINVREGTPGVALQRFLREASSLEELRALPEGFTDLGEYQHERVKIEHMVDRATESAPGTIFLKAWACWKTLTCLEMAFESECPVFDRTLGAMTIESINDHAILYGQLAALEG